MKQTGWNINVIPAGDANGQMIVGTEILNYQIINKRKHSSLKNNVYWLSLVGFLII